MKKIICLMLCVIMVLSSVSALAATKEIGAYSDEGILATNVYLEGKAEGLSGQSVTVLLISGDDVGYISEFETESDGTYKLKFKFKGDISGYDIKVRDSETSADITDSLVTAIAQKDVYTVDIDLNVSGNDVIKYASEGDILNIVADIENKYGDNKKVSVMLAAYDENNKLLATDIKTLEIGFSDLEAKKIVEFSDVAFPAEAVKAKAFAWQDTINLNPLTTQQTMLAYGDSRLFENRHEDQDDTWVVGLAGASTVQAGEYAAFLFQYYATRHPDKNVVIINKGCPGYKAEDIYYRLDWDIFNEDDILGFGACDEIAIMVGANDLRYTSYTYGKMDDDEYVEFYDGSYRDGKKVANMTELVENSFYWYTQVVEECKKRGKRVAFTPMTLYDDSEEFEHILYEVGNVYGTNQAFGMLSDKLEEYAREQEEAGYPITFLDTWGMSDEYTDMIRSTDNEEIKNYYMNRKGKEGYVFLGKDGLHHSSEGGYLVGYIIARGQETDPIVASVEIDAATNRVVSTEDADVTLNNVTKERVEYTYAPKALPMYVGAPGYIHGEKLGIDLTGTINQEIIKVDGLADGKYSIIMDGKEVTKATAEELASGVNIATLENNPGQIQAKDIYTFDAEVWGYERDENGNYIRDENGNAIANELYDGGRRLNEIHLRQIATEELEIRLQNTKKFGVDHKDPMYETFTIDDWCELAKKVGRSDENISKYRERKERQQHFANKVIANVQGTKERSVIDVRTVVISKVN